MAVPGGSYTGHLAQPGSSLGDGQGRTTITRRSHSTNDFQSHNKTSDSGDRIANALLESPVPGQYNGLFPQVQGTSDDTDYTNGGQRLDFLGHSPGTGRGRGSPPIPRKSSLRKLQQQGGIAKSRTGVLTPQTSSTARWNALRGKRTLDNEQRLPNSKTAPLSTLGMGDPGVVGTPAVTRKVEAMLAHSEALKPTTRDSRFSRMSAKVAAKASSTWGRFKGTKNAPKESIRGKISLPLELGQQDCHNASTIRIVNNASCILDPYHCHAIGSRDGVEPAQPRVGSAWARLHDSTASSFVIASANVEDPFKDPEDLTGDLDGVLSGRPLAASTPRIRRTSATPIRDSLIHKKSIGSSNEEEADSPLGQRQKSFRIGALSIQDSPSLQLPRPDIAAKKHPSPTKEELVTWSKNLQTMGVRSASPNGGDRDELAYSFEEGTPVTSRRTVSEQISGGVAEERGFAFMRLNIPAGCTPASLRGGSNIPGPSGTTRSATRFGRLGIHLGPDAMDDDELA